MNLFKYISLVAAVSALPLLFSSCSDEEDVIEFPSDIYVFEGTPNVKVTNLTLRSLGAISYDTGEPADELNYFGVAWTNPEDALKNGFEPSYEYDNPKAYWEVSIPYKQYYSWDDKEYDTYEQRFYWNESYNKIFAFFNNQLEFSFIPAKNITTTTLTFPDGTQTTLSASNPSYIWFLSRDSYSDGLYPSQHEDWKVYIVSKGKDGNTIYESSCEISIYLNMDYYVMDGVLYRYTGW